MDKEIIRKIKEINEETKRVGDEIADKVNQDKELTTWFQKWSYGVHLLEERGKEVMKLQEELRKQGHDIKINMQSYELSYYGSIKEA